MADAYGTEVEVGFFQLTVGAFWLCQAGLLSSRPGPERRQVIVYRAAWYLSALPMLVAAAAAWFL